MELKVKWWIQRVCISVHINTKKKKYLRAAPYVVLILQSYRWSKIVLLLRKTFRHLFLSELGLQLYLSLNNLPLPPATTFFCYFFPLLLSISHVRRLQGLKECSCQIKLLRTRWKLTSHTTKGETGVFYRLQQPISREIRSIVNR